MRNGTVFWHFMEGFHAEAPVSLTLTEQRALYFSKGLFRPLQGSPIYESLESAIQKIGSQLPAQSFSFLRGLENAVAVRTFGFKDYTRSKQSIESMTRAVFHKYCVRLSYQSPHDSRPTDREMDPYRIWYVNNALYVVGYGHLRNDLRVFTVDRIRSVSLTNRRFEIPEDFDFDAFTRTAFNMIWGETQEIKIRLSASQAPYIRERTWHPSQKIETEPDGSIILTLKVADLWEVKFWQISAGAIDERLVGSRRQDSTRQPTEGLPDFFLGHYWVSASP